MDSALAAQDLFPAIEPYDSGWLAVGGRHRLYWEVSGNPRGRPVVFLHGGPGAGASPSHRRFFDPAHYRIVIFDQRGSGRSEPLGETIDNTTDDLVADLERLRESLGIERWLIFGGSWGSTLALAYAQSHAERVTGLILRGIFLGSQEEVQWFLTGMKAFQPEAWQRFAGHIPPGERDDLLTAYRRRLHDPDPAVHLPAARCWSRYEGACATLKPCPDTQAALGAEGTALGLARLEAHYFAHGCFLEPGALLGRVDRLRRIPGVIVHGRYDLICPIITAERLHQAWPEVLYEIIPDAGHSAMEPGIRQALVQATERFKALDPVAA